MYDVSQVGLRCRRVKMDLSRETLLDELNDFEKKKPNDISPVLEDYLLRIAKCGDTMFPWSKLKLLVRRKLEMVMSDFYENCPTDNLPPVPNVELFKFDTMKIKILEAVDTFQSTPFTIQRLCELLTSPRKHYKRTDKFMRGIEKNILVVSTVEPRHCELANNNGSMVVNGILEISNEGEMLVSDQHLDNNNHLNNNNNNNTNNNNNNNSSNANLVSHQDRITVNGVPVSEALFSVDPSSSTSTTINANLGVTTEIESSSEDSSDGSTDSGGDYILKEASLDVISDMAVVSLPTSTVSCVPLDESSLQETGQLTTSLEDASQVEEEARQLLSQVAANIEESSLLVESTDDITKFPVSEAIIDPSLELGFGLGKDLSSECASIDDTKTEACSSEHFDTTSFITGTEGSPVDNSDSSNSPSAVVKLLEDPPVDVDPGILAQISTDTITLQPDCSTEVEDICADNVDIQINSEMQEKMDTDCFPVELPSSSLEEPECPVQDKKEEEAAGKALEVEEPPESSPLDLLPVEQDLMQEQVQQPSEEPMDQD